MAPEKAIDYTEEVQESTSGNGTYLPRLEAGRATTCSFTLLRSRTTQIIIREEEAASVYLLSG